MTDTARRPLWAGRTLALTGILLVALNLRTAVAALSPIIAEVRADVALPTAIVGVLGMLPPVCFAVFGIFTPVLTRRFGLEPVLIAAVVATIAGHLLRGLAPETAVLLLASVIAFAGLGMGNVLLPPLVKKYFPDRIGLVTTVYVTILSISTFLPPLVAVPLADSAGWRVSLGMWGLMGVLALVPWLALVIRHRTGAATVLAEEAQPAVLGRLWRSSVAWAITVVFAASALNAYALFAWLPTMLADIAGTTPAAGGALLSLFAAMGLPAGLAVPWLATRLRHVGVLVYAGVVFFLLGYGGLLVAPASVTWLWVVLAGLGTLLFPLALVLINLRTRTHQGSVALSGFAQGIGYSVGALGPLLVGLLHEWTGGWSVPLLFLAATAALTVAAGVVVARPHTVEDD